MGDGMEGWKMEGVSDEMECWVMGCRRTCLDSRQLNL